MTTRSLILSPHEVRAALDGRLGLVVRPVRFPKGFEPDERPALYDVCDETWRWSGVGEINLCLRMQRKGIPCPLGVPGDRLRCKETWRVEELEDGLDVVMFKDGSYAPIENTPESSDLWIVAYDNGKHGLRWRSPATMPAWASRITLGVVGVRCVRLHQLCENDMRKAYGIAMATPASHELYKQLRTSFEAIWDKQHTKRGYAWDSNPWVWAVEVRRVEG